MATMMKTLSARPVSARRSAAAKAAAVPVARTQRATTVCSVSLKQAAAGAAASFAAFAASPAFALVDDRLNGDGAGIALGVNEPVVGAHLLGVFTTIWALYWIANQSDSFLKSGGKDDDSGLTL